MNKHIIITGTSRGMGYETAKILAEAGHKVLALSRNTKAIEELQHPNISYFSFDLSNEEDLQKVSDFIEKEWKSVEILLHNAGKLVNKPFEEITKKDFEEVYNVNVFGVARLTQIVLPYMKEKSHVVAISSMGGVQGSMKFGGLAAYSSAKGAVITLMELLAEEYKEKGIAFNTLALGAVQTEMLQEAFPGLEAPVSAQEMAEYISHFALTGNQFFNGKLLQVSNSTP